MSTDIVKLYTNIETSDRRKSSLPVENDRRSGVDRRTNQRVLDKKTAEDITAVKKALGENQSKSDSILFSALKTVAPIRRFQAVSDNANNSDYLKAAGLLGLAVVNVPEDARDLKNAFSDIAKHQKPGYDYKNFQSEFSFIRGTFLEPLINKMGKAGAKIHNLDKSLFHTSFGTMIRDALNLYPEDVVETGRISPKVVLNELGEAEIKEVKALAYKVKGNMFKQTVGRALLRTPVMGLAVLGALEIPSLIKAYFTPADLKDKIESSTNQVAKSAINIATITACVSTTGAILARKGSFGSLLGIGLGAVIGSKASKEIQGKVFNQEKTSNIK